MIPPESQGKPDLKKKKIHFWAKAVYFFANIDNFALKATSRTDEMHFVSERVVSLKAHLLQAALHGSNLFIFLDIYGNYVIVLDVTSLRSTTCKNT